jgi:hypothetical protein
VERAKYTKAPRGIIRLLKIKEDVDKMLALDETILDLAIQQNQVVDCGTMAAEATLGIVSTSVSRGREAAFQARHRYMKQTAVRSRSLDRSTFSRGSSQEDLPGTQQIPQQPFLPTTCSSRPERLLHMAT